MKAVIFDMDGVIIDSEPIHNTVILSTLDHFGIPFNAADLSKFVGTTNTSLFNKLITKHALDISPTTINDYHYKNLRTTILKELSEPISGIRQLLSTIKHYHLATAIASSSSLDLINSVTQKFNISDYFQHLTSGENLPHSKPDPTIYLLTAKKLGVSPADCLVIEDAHLGVKAAKAAGMTCIGFQNPNSGNQDLSAADKIVTSITEINLSEYL